MRQLDTSITSHSYHLCLCVNLVRTLKIYSLSKFQLYNIAQLGIVIIELQNSFILSLKVCTFDQHLPSSPTPLAATIPVSGSMSLTSLDST